MSRQFSIFTKVVAFFVVVAMCAVFIPEAPAYHCDAEEDKFWEEFGDLLEKAAAMAVLCLPASLSTGVGVAACTIATVAFFRQSGKTRDANMAWDACKREHEPN